MSSNSDKGSSKAQPIITFQSFDRPEFWTGSYVEFAAEIGYVAWAWNSMHADLCDLFCDLLEDVAAARAVWNSIKSDTGQREALKSAAKAKIAAKPELLSEIDWLVAEINRLSAIRNNAFHSLWTTEIPDNLQELVLMRRVAAKPDHKRGNPKAARLHGFDHKDLFRALSGQLMTLGSYSRFLDVHVRGWDEGAPLPKRPQLPDVLSNYLQSRIDPPSK